MTNNADNIRILIGELLARADNLVGSKDSGSQNKGKALAKAGIQTGVIQQLNLTRRRRLVPPSTKGTHNG